MGASVERFRIDRPDEALEEPGPRDRGLRVFFRELR